MVHRRHARAPLAVLAALACGCAGAAAAGTKRFELADLAKIVRVSDPQISPDGRSIALVLARPDYDEDLYQRELVLVDVASGARRVLSRDRKGVSYPRWSPSGDRIAFLARVALPAPKGAQAIQAVRADRSGREELSQVFVLAMNGGDAQRITSAPNGVAQFAWGPDGRQIAFVTPDDPENKESILRHDDAFEVGDNDYLAESAPTPMHVWLAPADGGEARRLTSGTWSLPRSEPPGPPSSPLSWSPDGRSIAFVRQALPHFGDGDQTMVMVLDVATGAARQLTSRKTLEGFPSFSPDGARIAFWYPREGDPNNVNEVHVAPAEGGRDSVVTRAIDRNLARSIWMPDGKSLLVGGNDGTRVALWLQPLEGAPKKLDLGRAVPSNPFWVDTSLGPGGSIAFAGSVSNHPGELYFMESPESRPRALTDLNGETAALDLGQVQTIEWDTADGFHADGVLTLPPGFDPKSRYPVVVYIHGGPQSASSESFNTLAQLLTARGYVVFQPNYRGSDNLGNAFQHAIFNDAGDGPGKDVMAGIAALKKRGFVDAGRLAVCGWSYGGYMTVWLIGHYPEFKAAVAGAPVTDKIDGYDLADFNVLERYSFGGSPWVGRFGEAYRAQSPMTYAPGIKTPTLILADTRDARVPTVQSYKLFHALRDNGVVTKFFAYPVAGHFPDDPVRMRDVYRRWIDWIDQYLGAPSESSR